MLESPKTFAVNTPKAFVRYLVKVVKVVNEQEKRIIQLEELEKITNDRISDNIDALSVSIDKLEKRIQQCETSGKSLLTKVKSKFTAAAPADKTGTKTRKGNANV